MGNAFYESEIPEIMEFMPERREHRNTEIKEGIADCSYCRTDARSG